MATRSFSPLGALLTADAAVTDWLGELAQQQLAQQAAADTAAVSLTWAPRLAHFIFDSGRPQTAARPNLELISLLEGWRRSWSSEDERWPELEQSLDADRLAARRRFRD